MWALANFFDQNAGELKSILGHLSMDYVYDEIMNGIFGSTREDSHSGLEGDKSDDIKSAEARLIGNMCALCFDPFYSIPADGCLRSLILDRLSIYIEHAVVEADHNCLNDVLWTLSNLTDVNEISPPEMIFAPKRLQG